MSLESVIEANTAAIRDLIAALATGAPVAKAQVLAERDAEAEKVDKPKKTKPEVVKEDPKPEPVVEEAEEPAATPEPKDEPAAAEDDAAEITADDVTKVVLELGKAGKRPELVELLNAYGVKKGSELHKNDLAGFHKRATALLEG